MLGDTLVVSLHVSGKEANLGETSVKTRFKLTSSAWIKTSEESMTGRSSSSYLKKQYNLGGKVSWCNAIPVAQGSVITVKLDPGTCHFFQEDGVWRQATCVSLRAYRRLWPGPGQADSTEVIWTISHFWL